MRLTAKEQKVLLSSFQTCLSDISFELFLFGSRADDKKKGGDIDLLVIVNAKDKEIVVERKSKIRIKIFETLPEQKIDITVASPEELVTEAFLQAVRPGAILLGKAG